MSGDEFFKEIRIFIASPSDVEDERSQVAKVVNLLMPLADHLRFKVKVIDWRDAVPDMGRPQQVIFDQLKPKTWDIFIGILWKHFGTKPGSKNPKTQQEYVSGTEEEFMIAYRLWQQYRQPRILIYRCIRQVNIDSIDFEQLKRVRTFISQFDATSGQHPGLLQIFDSTEMFEKILLDSVQKLLIANAEQPRPLSQLAWHPEVLETMLALADKGPAPLEQLIDLGISSENLLEILGELKKHSLITLTRKKITLTKGGTEAIDKLRGKHDIGVKLNV